MAFHASIRARRWPLLSPEERFWQKVVIAGPDDDDCWYWLGAQTKRGYGSMTVDRIRGSVGAHRFSYEIYKGEIPDGMTVEHKCRNPSCVNPHHLTLLSMRDNILAGNAPSACAVRFNVCKYGHAFTPENTWVQQRTGFRYCRECGRRRYTERQQRRHLG